MNLKKRLILANASTVLIPVIATVLMTLVFLLVFGKLLGSDTSLEHFQRLAQHKVEILNIVDKETGILQHSPEAALDESFQKQLQEQLAGINGELIIIKDERLIFTSRNFTKIDLAKFIEAGNTQGRGEAVVSGDITYTSQLIDLRFKDGSRGSVLILTPVLQADLNLTLGLVVSAVTFILMFVLTNIIISYQFSRSILQPLHNLRSAAAEISRGNLDYPIAEEGDREIQALCRDLELMRIKLKDSVITQLKYEDNRKMLISSISHDLKTPVTSIKGYVEGILDGIANNPDKIERYLRTISLKAVQVDQMIDDLLLYAKLDLNQIPFDFERMDIEAYLVHYLSEAEPEFESNHIKLTLHNELPDKQSVILDRRRMNRVLQNILENSRQYMDKDPRQIDILLRDTFTSIIIELRDNGSGINEADLPYIFDRFYRSDSVRCQGSGLGLAIAKQIIEGHKGRVWAVSHGEEGTSIMISLSKL